MAQSLSKEWSLLTRFLKWIPSIATALTISVIIFSVIYEWGFFSIIGSDFQRFASASDYFLNAIAWVPGVLLLLLLSICLPIIAEKLGVDPLRAQFIEQKKGRKSPSANELFKFILRKNRWLFPTYLVFAFMLFFFVPDFGAVGAITGLILVCWLYFIVYLADDFDSPPLSAFSYLSILIVSALGLSVYFSRVADAYAKLQLSQQSAYDVKVVGSEIEKNSSSCGDLNVG